MRPHIVILLAITVLVNLSACSKRSEPSAAESSNIKAVQSAILPIDRSITVGGAFKQYPYTRNVKWTEPPPIMGRTLIDVSGDLDADRLFGDLFKQSYLPEVQFAKTHDLQRVEKEWRPKIAKMKFTCRFRLNADASVECIDAHFQEEGKGAWHVYGTDINTVLQMVYYSRMPLFILAGFVRPSELP